MAIGREHAVHWAALGERGHSAQRTRGAEERSIRRPSMHGWTTAKVFISSTFRDMQAERDCLVRFVFPHARERLALKRIHLVDVDLRWGITSEDNVVEACTGIIDECQPH